MTRIVSTEDQLNQLLKITIDFIGKPVKSIFNEMFGIHMANFPDDFTDVRLYADPTGSTSRFDVLKYIDIYDPNDIQYIPQPDIDIQMIFEQDIKQLYLGTRKFEGEENVYLVTLRRIGMPSVRYCIEHKLDNVYLISEKYARVYYRHLVYGYEYSTLYSKPLTQDFVDKHYELFNILDK